MSRLVAVVLGGVVAALVVTMLTAAGAIREIAPSAAGLFIAIAIYTVVIGLIFVPRIWRSR